MYGCVDVFFQAAQRLSRTAFAFLFVLLEISLLQRQLEGEPDCVYTSTQALGHTDQQAHKYTCILCVPCVLAFKRAFIF